MPFSKRVLDEPEHHADARGTKSQVPVDRLAKVAAHERSKKPAGVDAHVVDRKSRIPARAPFGIQVAHDRADVRLEESRADDDEQETGVKGDDVRNREREVADGDDASAPEHRTPKAEHVVGNPSARQRDDIDGRGVQAVNRRRGHVIQAHAAGGEGIGHVQHENGAHPVIAETLPHLREEERRQPARMSEPARVSHRNDRT